jgi:hypothetical protein
METALQGAKVWSSELGEFISQSHIILAGMLDDYSHGRFSLAYLPAAAQGAFGQHKPFQIQERREDGKLVPIRDLTFQEVDDPGEVMAWVAFGDIRRRGVNTVFEELEAPSGGSDGPAAEHVHVRGTGCVGEAFLRRRVRCSARRR